MSQVRDVVNRDHRGHTQPERHRVRGRGVDRINHGRLGPKGLYGWQANNSPERLTRPLVRRNGNLNEATWEEALEIVASRSQHLLTETGPSALGFYATGQLFLEDYYTLGVIAWTQWLVPDRGARNKMNMKPEDPGPLKDKKTRDELKVKYRPMLDEAVANMQKALDIDKEYDDAMAYMNLLIRYRADLDDSTDAYKKDVEEADNWVQKALATKKIKAERKPQAGGITGPAPGRPGGTSVVRCVRRAPDSGGVAGPG